MYKIGLVQINNSFAKQSYFPYSVGLLQGYLMSYSKLADSLEFLSPIFTRVSVEKAVTHLLSADVVLCSVYVWNIRLTTEIVKQLKKQNPNVIVIFGGPQVPDDSVQFMLDNPWVDIAVHGEGEATLTQIIDRLGSDDWRAVPGISYAKDGSVYQIPKGPRIKDLNTIPSPYLCGLFDQIMKDNPDTQWIAIWESNRGCPFSCSFCDWGSSTQSKMFQFELARLHEEIKWFSDRKIDFVFCCDSNFGLLPRDVEIAQYFADIKKKTTYPKFLSVQNTKNATERSYLVQKILSDSGFNKGVTISMQSMDVLTLKNIRRDNISLDSFKELQRRFQQDGVETYSDLILALPGETYDTFTTSIGEIIANGQHNRIQFNNLSILPNAEMGKPEYQKKFGMEIVETDIINVHGFLHETEDDIKEKQQLVIATSSMSRTDWVRTRSFCWMTALLHFNKLIQVPLLTMHYLTGIGYRKLIEMFTEGDLTPYPTVQWVKRFFDAKALDIQSGGNEYCHSREFLDIYWTADELCFILLLSQGKLDTFYQEAYTMFYRLLDNLSPDVLVLKDAFTYNKALIKRPFQTKDLHLTIQFDMLAAYQDMLKGKHPKFSQGVFHHTIDKTKQRWSNWEDYCREVIWYGNKKGAYLYTDKTQSTSPV